MKHLIYTLAFLLHTATAMAQYPLPSTRVYGDLTVDSTFVNEFAGVYLINDTIDLAPLPLKRRAIGVYSFDGSNLRGIYYLPNGLGEAIPTTSMRIGDADTLASIELFATPNSVGQLFALESTIGTGNMGFETQIDAGVNVAKMYATNFSGSTNLSVIEVDTVSVRIKTNDGATITSQNSNGLIIPSLSSEPTGENGAMYYNTSTNTFRVYENGAWRDM